MSGNLLRFPAREPSQAPAGLALYKLDPPPRPDGVAAAPAAVEALERHIERPITLLEAGAGSGASTLLSTWYAGTTQPAGWMTVEPEDEDPLRFAVHFIAAVHRAQPDLANDLHGLCSLPDSVEIEALWAEHFVAPLRQSGARAVVVLDELHHVLDSEACVSALAWLVSRMPSGLSLVCSSERPVHLTPGEVHRRARLEPHAPGRGTPPVIHLYNLRLDRDAVRDAEVVHPFGPSGVVAPLSTEDLDLPELEAFEPRELSPLSVPRRLSGGLVDRLLEVEDGAARLAALAEAGAGVRAEDTRGQWYRLTADFRAAQGDLLSPDARDRAHALSAGWYLEQGLCAQAVSHVAAGGDTARSAVDLPAWGEQLLERRAFAPLDRLVGMWADPNEIARYDAWRQLLCGAPMLARATLRAAQLDADADAIAAHALAALRINRTDEAEAYVTNPPEPEAGTRAAAVLDLVAGRLLAGADRAAAVERLRSAAEHARAAAEPFFALEAARHEIEVLVAAERIDDAQVRLREADAWIAEAHLYDCEPDAGLGCARAAIALAKERWSDTIAAAGRALDVLDPLPVARDRRMLAILVRTALRKQPVKETSDPVLRVVSSGEGHRGFARALGISTAEARLRIHDALEPHGVERWWQWLMS